MRSVRNLRAEGTGEVNGTGHLGELGQVDDVQLVVAGDSETTVDSLQDGDGDVGQLGVVLEANVTAGGQVGSVEGLELGSREVDFTLDLLQRGDLHAADVAEVHALGSAEVGELNLEGVLVERQVDDTGGVLEVAQFDGLQVRVGLDVKLANLLQGDTLEGGQTGVGDGHIVGLIDTLVERQGGQTGHGVETDLADGAELGHVEIGQGGDVAEGEVATNGGERVRADGADIGAAVTHQVTLDLLNTVEAQTLAEGALDGHLTIQGLAVGDTVGIALGLDGGVTALAVGEDNLGGCQRGQQVLEESHWEGVSGRRPR